MENIKVSVIIPVWNPGPGIERCIRSLRNQTLREIEMIFVDDLGTDGSMDLVREKAKEDPRIRILTNPENIGPGPSRNRGIEAAKGEYLSFVDPDDYVAEDFLERLYEKGSTEGLDIVKGRIVFRDEGGDIIQREFSLNSQISKKLSQGMPLYTLFFYQHQSALYLTSKVIETGAQYGRFRKDQDTTFLLQICLQAERFGITEDAVYYFVERQGSAMHSFSQRIVLEHISSLEEQTSILEKTVGVDDASERYVQNKIHDSARLIGRASSSGGSDIDTAVCQSRLQEVVQKSAFAPSLEKKFVLVRVLLHYGEALYFEALRLPWEDLSDEQLVEPVRRWVDFIRSNPDCGKEYRWGVNHVFEEAVRLSKGDRNIGKELLKEKARLPRKWQNAVKVQVYEGRFLTFRHSIVRKLSRMIPASLYQKLNKMRKG